MEEKRDEARAKLEGADFGWVILLMVQKSHSQPTWDVIKPP